MCLDIHDDFFPQLLSFELDSSASDDNLLGDLLSDTTTDSTLVLLQMSFSCIHCHVICCSHCAFQLHNVSSINLDWRQAPGVVWGNCHSFRRP